MRHRVNPVKVFLLIIYSVTMLALTLASAISPYANLYLLAISVLALAQILWPDVFFNHQTSSVSVFRAAVDGYPSWQDPVTPKVDRLHDTPITGTF